MARSSHLSRREGGRYYLQIRLKSFTHGSPSRLVRFSLGTSEYGDARHELADRMGWLLPMQTSKSSVQRYHAIRAQLEAFNKQGPVTHRAKLAARCNFEHVVRGLIDDLGGLKDDGPFNAAWMSFCQENLAAEERIATADRLDAYEAGRAHGLRSAGHATPAAVTPVFDPTRPSQGIVLHSQGNGRDTAASDIDVILAREAALQLPDAAILNQAAKAPTSPPPVPVPAFADAAPTQAVRISVLFEKYLAHQQKKNGDDRARNALEPIFKFTIALIGDHPPRAYTTDDFDHLNEQIPEIPARKGIPGADLTLHDRYLYRRANPEAVLEPITAATIKKNYHSGLMRFFRWLKKSNFIEIEPTLDLVTPRNNASLPRDSFDDAEILQLISLPLFTGCAGRERIWTQGPYLIQNHLYWGYLICLLTGMRTGEVASLKVSDIGVVDGIAYVDLRPFDASKGRVPLSDVRQLKTANSGRIVPLHPLLVELGLLDHRDRVLADGHVQLFPDCKPAILKSGQIRWSQALTKSWAYLERTGKVTQRANVSLYSSRHTMAAIIDEMNLAKRTRDRVLGHGDGTSAGQYGRKGLLSTEELKAITSISSPLIDAMSSILLGALNSVASGELALLPVIHPG